MTGSCQSCGMPLNRDPQGGATLADGTKSEIYCSLCVTDGAFVHPEFTAEQMQEFCVEQLKNSGMPGFMAWMFTRGIPNLDRWTGKAPHLT